MVQVWRCVAVAAALLAANGLAAQTVYKSVDDKGNVIYSENPPAKNKDGKIKSTTELSIDPNRNILPATRPAGFPPAAADQGDAATGESRAERVAAAKTALEAAEAQFKEGSEAQPGDFVGRAGGGVGPSPQRLQRLDDLQRAVDEARQNLEKAEGP